MVRTLIAAGFKPVLEAQKASGASLQLSNANGHRFIVQPVTASVIRVIHQLDPDRYPQKFNGELQLESPAEGVYVQVGSDGATVGTSALLIKVTFDGSPRLEWFGKDAQGDIAADPFMADCMTRAYSFDASTGAVLHYVEAENYLPLSEDESSSSPRHAERNEWIYGLGETRGSIEKSGKRYTMEGRDALAYSWTEGDPLYKVSPFCLVLNKTQQRWHGVFYNNFNDAVFDMSAEHDVLWGCFRSYKANCGPLDYYVLTGDGSLPSVLSEYATLLSPQRADTPFSSSPVLPPLSQFGYLSSSLSLAADPRAQQAVIEFLGTSREEGFPVDGIYLSSGWCQDPITEDRNYFAWNRSRYPDPKAFGNTVEQELGVTVIANIKPWLLDTHPMLPGAEQRDAFVRAAQDVLHDRQQSSESGRAKSWVWSRGFAAHALGSYFDFSSLGGTGWWKEAITEHLLRNNITGCWIDNNEMSGLLDGDATFRGELCQWSTEDGPRNVGERLGWGSGEIKVGQVGKMTQLMGMARATFEALLEARPTQRPVVVSRSGMPGIQAYAHASWSGDNSTTWQALKFGTKMTLSSGLSFGFGLYGHDIGGFTGMHHPSPELLVRWCQNGAWHTRFTVHSWKEVSTTLWMYKSVPGITKILQDVLAFRYRLAPTFYSLYVTDYHRRGWPVLKPLLWNHSNDPATLSLDEEFVFGSHLLVAPVTEKGATTRDVYLPSSAAGEENVEWCELDTGVWHAGSKSSITFNVPLERTLVLVRGGGIFVLGGTCSRNIYDGTTERTVRIFPSPASASDPGAAGASGSFTLIEDDGITNDHTSRGVYTELVIWFRCKSAAAGEVVVVEIGFDVVHSGYTLPYEVMYFELPPRDRRVLVAGQGHELYGGGTQGEQRVGLCVRI